MALRGDVTMKSLYEGHDETNLLKHHMGYFISD